MKTDKETPLQRTFGRRGFTLIELLTVIAIIGILAAILIPVVGHVREVGRRAVCGSNIRQQLIAFHLYSDDNNEQGYWRVTTVSADNAPQSIYPDYVDDVSLFICPSTKNIVRLENKVWDGPLQKFVFPDLETNAANREDASGGHSYEYFGRFQRGDEGFAGNDVIKNPHTVHPLETQIVLIVDGDDPPGTLINNCPDPTNNHGADGWNFGFADGHVEWVKREATSQKLHDSYMISGVSECQQFASPPFVQ